MSGHPVVLIFGPTAVGKTDLLVRHFSGISEVINADSVQVNRHMNIGTAKIDSCYFSQLPHHLIDCVDPDVQFSVADFVHGADILIPAILSRQKWPVISGGTAFYFKHFLYGLPRTPPADASVRQKLYQELALKGELLLFSRLQDVDPAAARRINPRDTYRLIRALEVFETSGKPLSAFSLPQELRMGYVPLIIGLDRDRQELYARINQRVDSMFQLGLLEEIKTLLSLGYRFTDPGMQGIGYKEFGELKRRGCGSLETVKDTIRKNSRHYAKRQLTFFRSLPGVNWVDADDHASVIKLVSQFQKTHGLELPQIKSF